MGKMPGPAKIPAGSTGRFLIVLWLALAGVPLAVAPGWFVAHDVAPKLLILALAVGACGLAAGEWFPGLTRVFRHRAGRVFLTAGALLALSLTVSALLSAPVPLSLAGTVWRRYGLFTQLSALFLGVACAGYFARYPGQVRRALAPLVAGGGFSACYGLLQYLGYDPIFDPRLYTLDYWHLVRPPATLGHAMYFAAYLLPVIFASAGLAAGAKSCRRRGLLLAVIGAAAVALVVTGVRSALLGLFCGAVVFAWRTCRSLGWRYTSRLLKEASWQPLPHGRGSVAIAAGAVFVLASAALLWSNGSRARWVADARGGPRLAMWKDSLALLRSHPLLGSGEETFAREFRRIESMELARTYPEYYQESPHNLTLEIALAQGAIGLAAAMLIAAVAVAAGLAPAAGPVTTGLLSALAAMLVALQFMPLTLPVALSLYCTVGMLVGLLCADGEFLEAAGYRWSRPSIGVLCAVLAGSALLIVFQDWTFARAGDALRRRDLAAAAAEYGIARALPYPLPGYDLWLARQLAEFAASDRASAPQALQLAMEASRRAEQYGEDPFNACYELATLAIGTGDRVTGERALREAIRLAPAWYKPRLLLAQFLLLDGREEEGKSMAAQASDRAGPQRAEVEGRIRELEAAMRQAGR